MFYALQGGNYNALERILQKPDPKIAPSRSLPVIGSSISVIGSSISVVGSAISVVGSGLSVVGSAISVVRLLLAPSVVWVVLVLSILN